MTLELYLAYLATVLLFFAHPPGPSQMLFIVHSMRHGVRRSLPTMAGDLSANSLQITIAGFGLAGLIHLSATFFATVKWLGVVYLVWIGIRIMRSSWRAGSTGTPQPPGTAFFRQGFVTSAANPYAVVFFAALFPQFIDPAGPLALQIVVLGTTYLVIDGALLLAMGLAAHRLVRLLGSAFARWLGVISGFFLIVAAVILGSRDVAPQPQAGQS